VEWLRSQIGLVSQEPVLFATSIRENILFGNEAASLKQVVVAAKMANAHDFITKLPHGYETNVRRYFKFWPQNELAICLNKFDHTSVNETA
jgi:ATP-binding cassette subfamily B (MDR/TAP) protein 1